MVYSLDPPESPDRPDLPELDHDADGAPGRPARPALGSTPILAIPPLVERVAGRPALTADEQARRDRQRALAALVVHDLRNPLAALAVNVQLIREDLLGHAVPPSVREGLDDCAELTARAMSMVAGILDVEELEAGVLVPAPTSVALAPLIARVTRGHAAEARLRTLTVEAEVAADLEALVDVALIERLLENLLDNAIRYARRGGRVVVAARRDGELLELVVGNDGAPIPASEHAAIFGRYYRLEARRPEARVNRGLGLYFCKLAVDAHRGTIAIAERPGLPACFVVRLPT